MTKDQSILWKGLDQKSKSRLIMMLSNKTKSNVVITKRIKVLTWSSNAISVNPIISMFMNLMGTQFVRTAISLFALIAN